MSDQRPTDINEARPSSIRHLIGQPSVVEQIVVALDMRRLDGVRAIGKPRIVAKRLVVE
jgi:hypothetical protein